LLRLPGKGYVYLGAHTKVHISRLRIGDKGLQIRLNLLTGDLWCQLDQNPKYLFEVSAKGLIARCHGTLFETFRQKDAVRVTVYEGPVVTVAHAKVKIAKSGEVVQYIQDRFRYKHRVKTSDEERLTQWKAHEAVLQGEKSVKTP
jgi:ferric-dicitrate binding protein FerR (iron transport regulator)